MVDKKNSGKCRLETGLAGLFLTNIILVLIAVLCAIWPMSDTDESLCTRWKRNETSRLGTLIDQITAEEIQRPQTHYLGWSRLLDRDAGTDSPANQQTPQAHFSSCFRCPSHPGLNDFDTLCWNESTEWSFCNAPLSYKDGRIRVKNAGYYFVYSRVLYDVSNLSDQWMTLIHDMIRESRENGIPMEKILENRHVLTKPGDNISSYLGAVFHLYAGDSIYVRVNKESHVYLSDTDSYFGLFSL